MVWFKLIRQIYRKKEITEILLLNWAVPEPETYVHREYEPEYMKIGRYFNTC